ncbi:MAG: autoinducer-binding domain protein [Gammaproteobacteria bacterium]|nr:autoinducer-binding domain protein [Gammaproteobacteria bacterium]
MNRPRHQYANYMSLKIIEKLGNEEPTEAQIAFMESILTKITLIRPITFHPRLTNQEIVCLYWAALGKTSKETAALLKVQRSTVEKHRKDIKKKLHCKSLVEAVFKGIQLGYVEPALQCELSQQPTEDRSHDNNTNYLTLSHSLRIPLTEILGTLELLDHQDLSPMRKEEINAIQQVGKRLLTIVDKILVSNKGEDENHFFIS